MEWLFLAGLAIWLLVLQIRLASVQTEVRALKRSARAIVDSPTPMPAPIPAATTVPVASPWSAPTSVRPIPSPTPRLPLSPLPPLPPPSPRPARPTLGAWMAENGLAWLGGGALALGGLLLAACVSGAGAATLYGAVWAA